MGFAVGAVDRRWGIDVTQQHVMPAGRAGRKPSQVDVEGRVDLHAVGADMDQANAEPDGAPIVSAEPSPRTRRANLLRAFGHGYQRRAWTCERTDFSAATDSQ
jgi:hypothetical protein